jgi:hypothetical protein
MWSFLQLFRQENARFRAAPIVVGDMDTRFSSKDNASMTQTGKFASGIYYLYVHVNKGFTCPRAGVGVLAGDADHGGIGRDSVAHGFAGGDHLAVEQRHAAAAHEWDKQGAGDNAADMGAPGDAAVAAQAPA